MFYSKRKNGLWICLDGPDFTGKKTQSILLAQKLLDLSEDNDVLLTHEPTKLAEEIKSKLSQESDPYSNAIQMTNLYIEDRYNHQQAIIYPALDNDIIVISNRHKYSTDAYQSAQGLNLKKTINMQKDKEIGTPDITILLSISRDNLESRMSKSSTDPDKFEKNLDFQSLVAQKYTEIAKLSKSDLFYFGNVREISANENPNIIARRKHIH